LSAFSLFINNFFIIFWNLQINSGKVGVQVLSRKKKDNQYKNERKNRLFQIRKNKREEILNKKRCIGALNGCPHIVVIEFFYFQFHAFLEKIKKFVY
jgi:hypothetical protein